MATPSNHWKLGLFVVLGICLGLATLLVLGARSLRRDTVAYVSYFDESVQGLEVGAAVKFRGVTIGNVSRIDIGPDRRHVRVTSEIGTQETRTLGLRKHGSAPSAEEELRIQLASSGITGVKFMQLDFFSSKSNPPPKLPFPVGDNYIPAAVSTMKNLEDAVVQAVAQFPAMTDAALKLIDRLDNLIDDVDQRQLPQRAMATLASAEQTFAGIRQAVVQIDPAGLSAQAQTTLGRLDTAMTRIDQLMTRVSADQGMVHNAERAANALGDAAVNARGLTGDLGAVLRDVQQAAESVERLSRALELDPDMLLKGRAKVGP